MIVSTLFYVFIAVVVIQIVYLCCFSAFLLKKTTTSSKNSTPISVIICAKNEAENLKKFLPSIIQQQYHSFEIVLINDVSSDNTLEVMEYFKEKHSNIKIVNVREAEVFWGNKKYALTLGIKAASYDYLLFTDADCYPKSSNWIQHMSNQFSPEKTVILGYGKYKPISNSFTNLLIRYETLLTAVQYFSYAYLGNPYMGVGRNLAYHRDEFFKNKGFINHLQIKSGDDDLFVQEVASKKNTAICIQSNSHTISNPPKNLYQLFRQKRRHISSSSFYKLKNKALLGFFYITKLMFYVLLIPVLVNNYHTPTTLFFIGLFYLSFLTIFSIASKRLKEKKISYYLPILDFFLVLFQFSIFITNSISKPTHWK